MATIVTRSGKGSPLTNTEVDSNFTNLNTDKLELSGGAMTGNLSFGDNDKAIFGAGSDLQIYHDGSSNHTFIKETGSGHLYVQADNLKLQSAGGDNYAQGVEGDGFYLYFDDDEKLKTTTTGILVTGTAVTDGLTVAAGGISQLSNVSRIGDNSSFADLTLNSSDSSQGTINFADASDSNIGRIQYNHTDNTMILRAADATRVTVSSTGINVTGYTSITGVNSTNNGEIRLGNNAAFQGRISYEGQTSGTLYVENSYNNNGADIVFRSKSAGTAQNKLKLDGNGDISFYEATGVTPKLTWDASAESLGIGTDSPTTALDVRGGVNGSHATFTGQANRGLVVSTANTLSNDDGVIYNAQTAGSGKHIFQTAGTERMRIDSSGLTVDDGGKIQLTKNTTTSGDSLGIIEFHDEDGSATADAGKFQLQAFRGADKDAPDFKLIGSDSTGVLRDRLLVEENGNISFYEDTGTDAIFYWDAGAESLCIGTDFPSSGRLTLEATASGSNVSVASLQNYGTGANTKADLEFFAASTHYATVSGGYGAASAELDIKVGNTPKTVATFKQGGDVSFYEDTGTTAKLFWDASAGQLQLSGTDGAQLRMYANAGGGSYWDMYSVYGTENPELAISNSVSGEAMRIDSSGNVGIGISNPATKLHVGGIVQVVENSNTAFYGGNFVRVFGDQNYAFRNSGGSYIANISVSGNSYFNGGNFGIGTNSPTSKLHVYGGNSGSGIDVATFKSATGAFNIKCSDLSASNPTWTLRTFSGEPLAFGQGTDERMRIDSSGNLLVGTTDDVVWDNSANSAADNGHNLRDDGRAGFAYYNATANANSTVNINRTGSYGDLIRFFKSGATVGSIGIQSSGLVIDGETSHTGLRFTAAGVTPRLNKAESDNTVNLGESGVRFKDLHLSGAVNAGGSASFSADAINIELIETNVADENTRFRQNAGNLDIQTIDDASSNSKNRLRVDHSSGDISFYEDTGNTPKMVWKSADGSLGIGTTLPNRKLTVQGPVGSLADFTSTTSTTGAGISFGDTNTSSNYVRIRAIGNEMQLYAGNSERVRIDADGNVGIGEDDPDSILHIQKTDATAYSSTANDGQVGVGPTIYLENPANSNTTVGGQIVFGMRSTEEQVRIGATGGTAPSIVFGTGDAERMRIDSSGNVGIGTDSPARHLDVVSAENVLYGPTVRASAGVNHRLFNTTNATGRYAGITLASNNSAGTTSEFTLSNVSTSSNYQGVLTLQARTGASTYAERLRVDKSGNFLLGKSALDTATAGTIIYSSGYLATTVAQSTANSGSVAQFRRNTTDGSIVNFLKDSSTVGSIGARSSAITIGNGDTGLRFDAGADTIYPEGSNTYRDAAIDIGGSSVRFKDAYLSGGVYLGGTGAANKLDDYEEVNFTATLRGSTEPSTLLTVTGFATKIGRVVQYSIGFEDINTTGYAGYVTITGLPFTNNGGRAVGNLVGYQGLTYSGTDPFSVIGVNSTTIEAFSISSNSSWAQSHHDQGGGSYFWLSGTYMTTA